MIHSNKTTFLISLFLFLTIYFISFNSVAQDPYKDFGFVRSQEIEVYLRPSQLLKYPWAGGMNSVRFSEIDIDLDGKKDLIVFEKHGNRLLPFINQGEGFPYRYAPEHIHLFPKMNDWVILIDYNGDGKEDIFTYGLAGTTVYQNISQEELKFKLITTRLQSFYYTGYSNIFTSPDDYMALVDIDGDGDLDILNFWLLGKYVHYHQNMSMERYGHADSLDFRLADECWGKFAEGSDNNIISLGVGCDNMKQDINSGPTRHVGSSLYGYDFSENGLIDLIIGDVEYPNLILLVNEGSIDSAYVVSQDTLFPNKNMPIHLFSMPAITFLDVNHDHRDEIIASPSDPSLRRSQDHNSVWLYEWSDISQQYELATRSFMQDEMIDVGSEAFPVLYDWDGDGLTDLFIGNYGRYDSSTYIHGFLQSYFSSSITYYKNIGTTTNPKFQFITDDFGELRQYGYLGLYPAFGDFNGDGKTDMLCGTEEGKTILFTNQSSTDTPLFSAPEINYQNIDVGFNSTPQYFDLDNDGKKDLLIGNRRGQISYYRNISENNIPEFQKITDQLGNVDVRNAQTSYFGYATPHFFRNQNQETVLFCGNEEGKIFYYKDIDGNLDGTFTLTIDEIYELYDVVRYGIREGKRVATAVGDLNDDGYLDLLVGNWAGGLTFFKGILPPDSTVADIPTITTQDVKIYPNPCSDYFYIDLPDYNYGTQVILSLYDIAGRTVLSSEINHFPYKVGLLDVKEGIYIGNIKQNGKVYNFKLIKTSP